MRVGIDVRAASSSDPQMHFFYSLLMGLSRVHSDLEFLIFYNQSTLHKRIEQNGGAFRSRFQWIKTSHFSTSPFSFLKLITLLKMYKIQLYHHCFDAIPSISIPVLTSVFNPAAVRKNEKIWKRTKMIHTLTFKWAQEIEKNLSFPSAKMRVLKPALLPFVQDKPGLGETTAMKERYKIEKPYIFCVQPRTSPEHASRNQKILETIATQHTNFEFLVYCESEESYSSFKKVTWKEWSWFKAITAEASLLLVLPPDEGSTDIYPYAAQSLAVGTLPLLYTKCWNKEYFENILPFQVFFSEENLQEVLNKALLEQETLRAAAIHNFAKVQEWSVDYLAEKMQILYKEMILV